MRKMKRAACCLFAVLPLFFVRLTFTYAAETKEEDKPNGNAPVVFLPGHSNQKRWDFLQSHLKQLSESKKSEVKNLLGRGVSRTSDAGKSEIWSYLITDNQADGVSTDLFYELKIHFVDKNVALVEVKRTQTAQPSFTTNSQVEGPLRNRFDCLMEKANSKRINPAKTGDFGVQLHNK